MKKLFMICNAHIDPVWLWKKQDGIAAVLSTFRSAARLLKKYDFIFCHNESFDYEIIEKYDPQLFAEILELHKSGKWKIMGGWDIQPDCNMPSGESILRHIESGRKYFYEKFSALPRVAINFDPFGHSDGLIQILSKCGYEGYIICRPTPQESDLPENFIWEKNGKSVKVARPNEHYNCLRGKAREKAEKIISENSQEYKLMLWGIGNHGGGPSELDLVELEKLIKEEKTEIVYSYPEEYFGQNVFEKTVRGSLNPCMPGCYTVQCSLKQRHRLLENEYYAAEKLCAQASFITGREYPAAQLDKALRELLFSQFHDSLPGSAVQEVETQIMRAMDYALHVLENEKYDALVSLAMRTTGAERGEYPFFVYNPLPYPAATTLFVDLILENQNYGNNYTEFDALVNGAKVSSQTVKEMSNINLDWAKKIAIDCVLPPMSLSRIGLYERKVPKKPNAISKIEENFTFENEFYRAEISGRTGLVDGVWYSGKRVLEKNSCAIDVIADNADPWAMDLLQHSRLGERIGRFTAVESSRLRNYIEGSEFSGCNVRVVENGEIMTCVEAVLEYEKSDAVIEYKFYKNHGYFDVDIRMNNHNIDVAYKLAIKMAGDIKFYGESMFGQEEFVQTGCEVAAHRWVRCEGEQNAVNVYNRGTYGFSFENGTLYCNLLRAAAYSAHPLEGRELLPEDRVIERIDSGVRKFSFRIEPCPSKNSLARAGVGGEFFNTSFGTESYYPIGTEKNLSRTLLEFDKDYFELCSLRKTECGYKFRVYNSSPRAETVKVKGALVCGEKAIRLNAFEFGTYLIADGELTEADSVFDTVLH